MMVVKRLSACWSPPSLQGNLEPREGRRKLLKRVGDGRQRWCALGRPEFIEGKTRENLIWPRRTSWSRARAWATC